jgi:Bax protein
MSQSSVETSPAAEARAAQRRGVLMYTLLLCGLFTAAYHPESRQLLHFTPVQLQVADAIEEAADEEEPAIPDFAAVADPDERKQLFFEFLQPYVDAQNDKVRSQRARLLGLLERIGEGLPLERRDRVFLLELGREYQVEGTDYMDPGYLERLRRRVDVLPPSLVLAQAAKESGWGSSRFAKEAYNFFGQWCFEQGCGLVPSRRRASASHEVKAFDSIEAAVQAYFQNLNTFPSYIDLRLIREQLRAQDQPIDGLALTEGLYSYSERGHDYVRELQSLIRYNELQHRDHGVSNLPAQD